jgi:hypothetical protein
MLQVAVDICRATMADSRVVGDTHVVSIASITRIARIAHVAMELAEHKHVLYYDE